MKADSTSADRRARGRGSGNRRGCRGSARRAGRTPGCRLGPARHGRRRCRPRRSRAGLIDWCDWMWASARMRSRSTAAPSNSSAAEAWSMRCDKRLLDFAVAAAQEAAHLVDDARTRLVDAADAGRRAALDLVLQAGPRARGEHAVGAGAQRKGALQGIERAVDRGGRGEGAEILVARLARAAMLGELRPFGVAADHDVGKRLVVAQQHVEARPEALDQVVLEQQRLGLAAGDRELHGRRRRHHADQARGEPGRLGVGGDPAAQRARLADIEHLAVGRDHAVDAGLARQRAHELADDPHAVGQRCLRAAFRSGRRSAFVGSRCRRSRYVGKSVKKSGSAPGVTSSLY